MNGISVFMAAEAGKAQVFTVASKTESLYMMIWGISFSGGNLEASSLKQRNVFGIRTALIIAPPTASAGKKKRELTSGNTMSANRKDICETAPANA